MFFLKNNREKIIRIIADILIINFSLILALALHLFFMPHSDSVIINPTYNKIYLLYVNYFLNTSLLLTTICILIFYFSGFYTYGRFYRGQYKSLIILQAVSLAYILFGFVSYFVIGALQIPRSVLFISYILCLVFLNCARLWANIWSKVLSLERYKFIPSRNGGIDTVLVIGGAGYIGSALIPKLLKKGYRVRLLDLLLYGIDPIKGIKDHPQLEIVKGDFRQVHKVVEVMREIDAVIHLGAIVGDPACALDEALTIDVNLMATKMIAEVAKGNGVNRFIFASTCSVYGAGDDLLNEQSALNPVSLYARSKIASERVLMGLASSSFSPIMLRFGTIYGLSGRTRFDLVINLLTAKALTEGVITVFGGDQWRPFLHVDDAAKSVFAALQAPLAIVGKEVFNVGSNEQNFTIQQAAEIINRLIPEAEIKEMGMDTDKRNYRVDFSKIRNVLKFEPEWSIEQGVQQVIKAIKTGKVKDYKNEIYSNYKFLSEEGLENLIPLQKDWANSLLDAKSQ